MVMVAAVGLDHPSSILKLRQFCKKAIGLFRTYAVDDAMTRPYTEYVGDVLQHRAKIVKGERKRERLDTTRFENMPPLQLLYLWRGG